MVGLSLAGLVALIIAGIGTLLAFPPTTLVRDRLIQEVKARTGRDVAITGATKFSVLPKLSVSMAGVTVSPPPGMAGAPTLTMASLDAEVRLWPMIMRDIVIDRLVLRQPVIDMRIDARGRKSWDFAGGTNPLLPSPPIRYAQAGGKDLKALPKEVQDFVKGAGDAPGKDQGKDGGRSAASRLDNLTLSDVRIENGSLHYSDERTGLTETITGLETTLTAKSLASPLEATGRMTWNGELVDFSARATICAGLSSSTARNGVTLGRRGGRATDAGRARYQRPHEARGQCHDAVGCDCAPRQSRGSRNHQCR
jgi:AsmA protein